MKTGHDFRTVFNDQEWESILNHSLTIGGPMSINTTVHRFVKAAPDLLSALQLAVAALEGKPCRQQALDDARAAIAKMTASS